MMCLCDYIFHKKKLLNIKDTLYCCSTSSEKIEIVVFVLRNSDIVVCGTVVGSHHPVVRWLPWLDDVKKKICAITMKSSQAEWALVICYDGSLYLIPVLSLLGLNLEENCSYNDWSKHDVTQLKSPISGNNLALPCVLGWLVRPTQEDSHRQLGVIGSTHGAITVFSLLSGSILFTSKIEGCPTQIEINNKPQYLFILITNRKQQQWRISLEEVDSDSHSQVPQNLHETEGSEGAGSKLNSSEKEYKYWKTIRIKKRNKKVLLALPVKSGGEEIIPCDAQWNLNVKMHSVLETFISVHQMCLSTKYPTTIISIEDFSSEATTVHKLPEDITEFTVTKSLFIFTNNAYNQIKIVSRHLSICQDESNGNIVKTDFNADSLLMEHILPDKERVVKIFCTSYHKDRCIVLTNQALYTLRLKQEPHHLVFRSILEKDNLQFAEKLSFIFNLDLQKLICEAADAHMSKGLIEEANHLYGLSRCGSTHQVLMLAVLGHMPELLNALKANNNVPGYNKLHFMNLKLLVFLHQYLTEYTEQLRDDFRDILQQNGYDDALAVSVLAQAGLCEELLFLTRVKGLHLVTFQALVNVIQCKRGVHITSCDDFWILVSDSVFREALLAKSTFLTFHHKLVQKRLSKLNVLILKKLESLYDPFSIPLRAWITNLIQGDVSLKAWIQTYILICSHLSLRDNHLCINMLNKISVNQDWTFTNSKANVMENKIGAGYNHATVLLNGNAYSWGSTTSGCLGNGPTNRSVAVPGVIEIFLNLGVRVFSVASGRNHSLAITDNGVYCWGNNKYGQLGIGTAIQSWFPTPIDGLSDSTLVHVAAGQYHSLAVDHRNRVFTWGWGVHGQLGHSNIEDCNTPQIIQAFKNEKIIWCEGGQAHSIFLSSKGEVWVCGSNAFGQLGAGNVKKSSVPVKLEGIPENVISIAAGYFRNFAVTSCGKLYQWGCSPNLLRSATHIAKRKMQQSVVEEKENHIPEDSYEYLLPKIVDTSSVNKKIVKVVAGSEHNALLTEDGRMFTWGRNVDGQLGIQATVAERRTQNISSPNEISFGADITDIGCGYDFTIAVDSCGNVWTFGANIYSSGSRSALAGLEGEIIVVNNRNRVIKLPHHADNVQPLPTLLRIPPEQKVLRKDLKPEPPAILCHDDWRYRMHYAIETLSSFYNDPDFLQQVIAVGDTGAVAKLFLLSGDIPSSLRITLALMNEIKDPTNYLKKAVSYYLSLPELKNLREVLIHVIQFWSRRCYPISELEDLFLTLWKIVAPTLGQLFFRLDSGYNYLSLLFSTKFKLELVEFVRTQKDLNSLDFIFDGCSDTSDISNVLCSAEGFMDFEIDPSCNQNQSIIFKKDEETS